MELNNNKSIRVLSLFDGMSCGQQALERIGANVLKYYASEIDQSAIKVTMANYPKTIQLGSVTEVNGYDLPKIDLLIGGSPCQSFSFAGKRKGMATTDNVEVLTLNHYLQLKKEGYAFEGQSYLFWEYMRILQELRAVNPNIKFLLENVLMGEKWQKILTRAIGINPIQINSALVSAQNRNRLYWTNIASEKFGLFGDLRCTIPQPKDKGILLKDILEVEVDDKYFLSDKGLDYINRNKRNLAFQMDEYDNKSSCITAVFQKQIPYNQIVVHNTMPRSSKTGKGVEKDNLVFTKNYVQYDISGKGYKSQQDRAFYEGGKHGCLATARGETKNGVLENGKIRRLTPIECERLQTVKDNYTNYVSNSKRYKMLGNGWTVDVIAHILSYFLKAVIPPLTALSPK